VRSAAASRRPIFLLSPADCNGKRAQLIANPAAGFDLARRLHSRAGAPLGDVFAFVSGLYFRGKLAYARAFASQPDGIMVITPSDGLRHPDTRIKPADLRRYAAVSIETTNECYRKPLERDLSVLARRLDRDTPVVLLGSLATDKYLEVLRPMLGASLRFPLDFIGLGDMSRGSILLRRAGEGRELKYAVVGDSKLSRAKR